MIPSIDYTNQCLSILGYSEGEKVFIRNLYCDRTLKDKFPPVLKTLAYPIKENQITQDEGYGVYFVVNGGGRKAKDVTHAKALFCEFDNLSESEQFRVITKTEGLPVPTFYIKSGGKSVHFYWVFDEPVPIAQWQELIKDLIDFLGSDPAIKDPSRIMRLPEFYHYSVVDNEIKQNNKSEFNLLSGEKYSYQYLRDSIPHKLPKDIKEYTLTQIPDHKIIDFLYEHIKPHQKGTNTYQNYRELFGAIKNLYGEDLALKFGQESTFNDGYNWEQIIKSTNGNFNLGTIYYQLIELGFITKQDWIKLCNYSSNKKNTKFTVTSETKKEVNTNNKRVAKLDNIAETREILINQYSSRLKFNELKKCVELDDEEAFLDDLYLKIHEDHGIKISKQIAYDLAVMIAKRNSYHPVKNYLDNCNEESEEIDIRNLSSFVFGTTDKLHDEMLFRHLIGSVARVYKSGCKLDTALILQGSQGIGKSSFFKVLYGDNFFTDSVTGTDKDNLLILHQHWCAELAEFETITSKKASGELKAFLSKSVDTFREPYARSSRTIKRQSIIVGSVNECEFLVDATGNRRFWVIPVKTQIDLEKVSKFRDVIWSQAKKAFFEGEFWHLSYESQKYSEELNKQYLHTDSWDSVDLDNYLSGFEDLGITIREILINHLGFEESQIKRSDEMRMSKILTSKSWFKKQKYIDGKKYNKWFFAKFEEKVGMVGMVGITHIEQDFQTYQPPTNLNEVGINEKVNNFEKNSNLPTSNKEYTNLNDKVGSLETIDNKGIYQPPIPYQPFSDLLQKLDTKKEKSESNDTSKTNEAKNQLSKKDTNNCQIKSENEEANELDFKDAKREINSLFIQLGYNSKEQRLNYVNNLYKNQINNFFDLSDEQIAELFMKLQEDLWQKQK
ncbi:virulence-associated E family protein [Cyanobacterium aponinum]|uniref:Virulence-associated E family protein n=1 Tax=Cyanobacterium aponinum (strain PCC 10605) TaxID=755178 RepID=K9Z0R0_CYAAP|nr:virulence-associated E family protein [Cyanobacterium aponinum]AFZ52739.1 virulence-associated E family protein [Cyanobacterium aponinum PCC 10605]